MSTKTIATQRASMGIPTGRLTVWWVLMSEIVIFGGVLVSYLMHRLAHPEWAEQAAYTNTWAGAFNTFVLLTSSLVYWGRPLPRPWLHSCRADFQL